MKECVQPYYLKDGQILDCGTFHMGLIDEGKSIYEVARLAGNTILFLEDHLDRLFASLEMEGMDIPVRKEKIMLDELGDMNGLFLTGTSLHVLPVSHVNELELPVGNGTMRRVMQQYETIIQKHRK